MMVPDYLRVSSLFFNVCVNESPINIVLINYNSYISNILFLGYATFTACKSIRFTEGHYKMYITD